MSQLIADANAWFSGLSLPYQITVGALATIVVGLLLFFLIRLCARILQAPGKLEKLQKENKELRAVSEDQRRQFEELELLKVNLREAIRSFSGERMGSEEFNQANPRIDHLIRAIVGAEVAAQFCDGDSPLMSEITEHVIQPRAIAIAEEVLADKQVARAPVVRAIIARLGDESLYEDLDEEIAERARELAKAEIANSETLGTKIRGQVNARVERVGATLCGDGESELTDDQVEIVDELDTLLIQKIHDTGRAMVEAGSDDVLETATREAVRNRMAWAVSSLAQDSEDELTGHQDEIVEELDDTLYKHVRDTAQSLAESGDEESVADGDDGITTQAKSAARSRMADVVKSLDGSDEYETTDYQDEVITEFDDALYDHLKATAVAMIADGNLNAAEAVKARLARIQAALAENDQSDMTDYHIETVQELDGTILEFVRDRAKTGANADTSISATSLEILRKRVALVAQQIEEGSLDDDQQEVIDELDEGVFGRLVALAKSARVEGNQNV